MSLYRYFKPVSQANLPNPNSKEHGLPAAAVRAANEKINRVLEEDAGPSTSGTSSKDASSKKRRGMYGVYDAELRAKIGRYAAQNGVMNAKRKFSTELKKNLNESTVRVMKEAYLREKKFDNDVTMLPKGQRGRPVLLGKEWDGKAKAYVSAVRKSGGSVSTKLVIAGTKGLLQAAKPPILAEHGGSVTIDKTWARSLLDRMGYTKRKATKGIKNRPTDLDEIAGKFHRRIGRRVRKFDIPDPLIINWDQTSVEVIPASSWTMHPRGEKQVPVKGTDDKRCYTSLLACTLSGDFLPPEIIYQGKTTQCHSAVDFPHDWDIWHTETHWSNTESMLRYVDKIITPYVEAVRDSLGRPSARPLLIFDVFKAHNNEQFRSRLEELGYLYVYVPGACTDELQPLDMSVNSVYKKEMQAQFSNWYSQQVAYGIEKGETVENIVKTIDLRTASIKPIHARWLMNVHEIVRQERDIIVQGFQKTGILKAVADARANPIPSLQDSDAEGEWDEEEEIEYVAV